MVDLSVIAISALVLGGSLLVVADVDGSRPKLAARPADALPNPPEAAVATIAPPVGLTPAPRARRQVVVVRRSRAS